MGLRYAGDVAIRQPSAQATVPDPFIELLAYARANDFDLPMDKAVELARALSCFLDSAAFIQGEFELSSGPDGAIDFTNATPELRISIEIPPDGLWISCVVRDMATRKRIFSGKVVTGYELVERLRAVIG